MNLAGNLVKVLYSTARKLKIQSTSNHIGDTHNWARPVEATDFDLETISIALKYSMTSPQRLWSLIQAVKYISENKIPGDICECGVWRGGSVIAIARTLESMQDTGRRIYLYDTFEGMTKPSDIDKSYDRNELAQEIMDRTEVADGANIWARASLEDVKSNLENSAYPFENYVFVKGDVAKTLIDTIPSKLALLRLDTDWYESTLLELQTLYPAVSHGGVVIIDDYGHWQGCRKAVEEYFRNQEIKPLLNYVDYTGRLLIKI